MTQTIIICLSIIAIVAIICYTSYKISTFRANHKALDEINKHLGWLKVDCKLNSDMLNKVWDNSQEIKQYLQKIVNEIIITRKRVNSSIPQTSNPEGLEVCPKSSGNKIQED